MGPLDISVGTSDQVPDQVLDIAPHIAGLGKLGGIGLHEWHANEIGDAANQVSFPHTRRPEENDVLLGVIRLLPALRRQSHVMIVIAQGHAKNLLGLRLLYHKAIKIRLDVARFPVKCQRLLSRLARLARLSTSRIRRMKRRPVPRQMLPHQFLQLALQFLG